MLAEIINNLAYHVDTNYRFIKLGKCTYKVKENTLFVVFLFAEEIGSKLETLKARLEKDCLAEIGADVKTVFSYKKSYIDELLLKMEVKKFLCTQFGVLTLDLGEDDIHVTKEGQNYTINLFLPNQSVEYIEQSRAFSDFTQSLKDKNFCYFEFYFNEKKSDMVDGTSALEKLEKYMSTATENEINANTRVNKSLAVKNIEYWLGKPIKERPIKAEFLKVSQDDQVTAGEIKFLSKREYNKKDKETGETTPKPYWTFVLADGHGAQTNCVFFPSDKTYGKFEKLVNGTIVCTSGIYSERNGRTSFRVNGVSFCELV